MASPTRKAPSSQRRLPSTLLLLGVLLAGSAALLLLIRNATTTLRETTAVRSRDREQLRRPPRHAAARRFGESGNQREAGNAIGVSGASTKVYHHLTTEPSHRRKRREKRAQASQFDSAKFDSAGDSFKLIGWKGETHRVATLASSGEASSGSTEKGDDYDDDVIRKTRTNQNAMPTPMELPRRIHIIARNLHDTVYVGAWIRYHPHWNITVWTDDNMLQYMETHATQYLPTYRALIGAKKSDFFRLIVLFMLGGVYADADVEPLQSLEPYLTEHRAPCMFTEEPDLHKVALYDTPTSSVMPCNFILAGVPNAAEHKHLIDVIANIASNQTELKGADATAQTGPGLLRSERGALSACHVAPARLFAGRPADNNPLIVTKCAKVFHSTRSIFIPEQLRGELRTACCDARDTPLWQKIYKVIPQGSCPPKPNTDDVLTLHHWSHSWAGDKNARRRRL